LSAADIANDLAFLAETPKRVATLVQGLDRDQMRIRGPGDGFSAVEQVCHLRDVEQDGYTVRARRMLEEDDPQLASVDGSQLAIERDYQSQNLAMALLAFDTLRHETLHLIKNASAAQLERRGHFADCPAFTVSGLARMMREHDTEHLAELEALRSQLKA
jgi:DinB family protein